jgi:hypothetical protein
MWTPRHLRGRGGLLTHFILLSQTSFALIFLFFPDDFFQSPTLFAHHSCRASVLQGLVNNPHFDADAIAITTWQRFGNNVMQLIRALHYAEFLGIPEIYVEPGFIFINRTFRTTRGIIIHGADPPRDIKLLRHIFFATKERDTCMGWDIFGVAATFKSRFGKLLPRKVANRSCIYAHVRSGDIFAWHAHRLYGQPPCSYYAEAVALDAGKHSCVRAIAEDDLNPCLAVLIGLGAVWEQRELIWDVAAMVQAKRAILARGSFGLAALYLSPVPKVYYAFAIGWEGLGKHMCCEPTDEYQEKVMKQWAMTAEQIRLMMTAKCRVWWEVPR